VYCILKEYQAHYRNYMRAVNFRPVSNKVCEVCPLIIAESSQPVLRAYFWRYTFCW